VAREMPGSTSFKLFQDAGQSQRRGGQSLATQPSLANLLPAVSVNAIFRSARDTRRVTVLHISDSTHRETLYVVMASL
jgi:hypothetical protein